jgi:hypothetical protein
MRRFTASLNARLIASTITLGLLCAAWPAQAQRASVSSQDTQPDTLSSIDLAGASDLTYASAFTLPDLTSVRSEPADWAPPGITFGEDLAPRKRRPPLAPGRVSGEIVAGAAFGGVFALAGLTAGSTAGDAYGRMSRDMACDDVCADLARQSHVEKGAVIGAAIAYPLGTGLGVAWVGNAGKQKGSLGAAIGGSYLGALAGALVGEAAGNGMIGFLVGAPLGATIAFNSTREYERPGTGLVNLSGGRTRPSVPAVSVSPEPVRLSNTLRLEKASDVAGLRTGARDGEAGDVKCQASSVI